MKIILADLHKGLVAAWNGVLANAKNITVHHGSIFDVEADALVSPANSFGFMDGGLDLRISEFFGWHVQEHLQALIQTKYHGELLIGAAEIVATDHPKIPYVISAPTMRVPMILGRETANVYLATRAVLLLVRFGRFECGAPVSDVVKSVAFPGMGTGVGKVPPDICARQMKQAIDDVNGQFQFPRSWSEAQSRHQSLYSDSYRDLQYESRPTPALRNRAEQVVLKWYARPVLFVSDLQVALRFYLDRLGFKKKWHAGDGKGTVCQVDRGECEIILCEDSERQDKGRLFVELTRDGLDELRREIVERSVPTQKAWWGYDVIRITDPDGNELLFPLDETNDRGREK